MEQNREPNQSLPLCLWAARVCSALWSPRGHRTLKALLSYAFPEVSDSIFFFYPRIFLLTRTQGFYLFTVLTQFRYRLRILCFIHPKRTRSNGSWAVFLQIYNPSRILLRAPLLSETWAWRQCCILTSEVRQSKAERASNQAHYRRDETLKSS